MEFVSRYNAAFSAYAKIWGDLGVQITFSRIMEFVKCAKSLLRGFEEKNLVLSANLGRDLRFPYIWNLYRAVMRLFRRMQKSGVI